MYALSELKETFFKFQQEGYASDAVKNKTAKIAHRITIIGLEGYKGIEWEEGPWRVVDCWTVEQNTQTDMVKSAGFTTIWHKKIPIFVMHYGGAYVKSVVPFLKKALLVNYETSYFEGGRGPSSFQEGSLLYLNDTTCKEFPNVSNPSFKGEEKILEFGLEDQVSHGVLRGWHRYFGILL
ncbi:MAG: hypothetical protein HYS60_01275 [Candidatus Wildermuthbacteria bacterium]|nr:hypothetical protein [Candidatus Wildermuthbacteria bacterium]